MVWGETSFPADPPMPYDGETRSKNEMYALDVVKRVRRGRGRRKALFYVCFSKSDCTSLVLERFMKDKTGVKTLAAGKKMKAEMAGSPKFLRGIVEADEDGALTFVIEKKQGNPTQIHKQLWQDLARRGKGAPGANPAALRLSKLLKRTSFEDRSGEEGNEDAEQGVVELDEQAFDADFANVDDDADLTAEDYAVLGLSPEEVAQLELFHEALDGPLGTLTGQLDQVMKEADEEQAAAGALAELEQELAALRGKLDDYATLEVPEAERLELVEHVRRLLERVRDARDGPDPWPAVGSLVVARDQVLVDIVAAQQRHLDQTLGRRTVGLEVDYVGTHLATPRKALSDHRIVFTLRLRKETLVEFRFVSLDGGPKAHGTLEAIARPVDADSEEGRERLRALCEGIDAVQAVFLSWVGKGPYKPRKLVKAVNQRLDTQKLALKTADVPRGFLLSSGEFGAPFQAPRVEASYSLAGLQDTFRAGDPFGDPVTSAMMKDAAADADDVFRALTDGRKRPDDVGPGLKGLLTLLVQLAQRIALEHRAVPVLPGLARTARLTLRGDPPREVERTWVDPRDRLALMPKLPLARLAQDGGLTAAELALMRDPEVFQILLREMNRILARQGPDRLRPQLPLSLTSSMEPNEQPDAPGMDLGGHLQRIFGMGEAPPMPPRPDPFVDLPTLPPNPPFHGWPPRVGRRPELSDMTSADPWSELQQALLAWTEQQRAYEEWKALDAVYQKLIREYDDIRVERSRFFDETDDPNHRRAQEWHRWNDAQNQWFAWVVHDPEIRSGGQREGQRLRVPVEHRRIAPRARAAEGPEIVLENMLEVRREAALRRARAVVE